MTSPAPRSRGRPRIPAEQQRRRLLDAAERTFERQRYEGASVQAIVSEAGMSSRSFYEFFDSKEELVIALAKERADTFLEQMLEALRATDDLDVGVDNVLRVFLENLPVVLLELESLSGTTGKQVRDVRSHYRGEISRIMVEEIARLAGAGVIESVPSPMALSLVIAGIEGIVIRYHGEGRREDLLALYDDLRRAVHELFPRFLGPA